MDDLIEATKPNETVINPSKTKPKTRKERRSYSHAPRDLYVIDWPDTDDGNGATS